MVVVRETSSSPRGVGDWGVLTVDELRPYTDNGSDGSRDGRGWGLGQSTFLPPVVVSESVTKTYTPLSGWTIPTILLSLREDSWYGRCPSECRLWTTMIMRESSISPCHRWALGGRKGVTDN